MGQLNKPLDSLEILDNIINIKITHMKKRITKTKLLQHLTDMIEDTQKMRRWARRHKDVTTLLRYTCRYDTILSIRDYINIHRI